MELIGEMVILREFKLSDLDYLTEILTDKEVARLAGFKVKVNILDILYTLSKFVNTNDKNMVWAITLKDQDNAIGWIELHCLENVETNTLEMGFVLNRVYWGRGLMYDAINLVKDYAFSKLQSSTIQCSHFKDNTRSKKIIQKSGFIYLKEDNNKISYIIDKEVV